MIHSRFFPHYQKITSIFQNWRMLLLLPLPPENIFYEHPKTVRANEIASLKNTQINFFLYLKTKNSLITSD